MASMIFPWKLFKPRVWWLIFVLLLFWCRYGRRYCRSVFVMEGPVQALLFIQCSNLQWLAYGNQLLMKANQWRNGVIVRLSAAQKCGGLTSAGAAHRPRNGYCIIIVMAPARLHHLLQYILFPTIVTLHHFTITLELTCSDFWSRHLPFVLRYSDAILRYIAAFVKCGNDDRLMLMRFSSVIPVIHLPFHSLTHCYLTPMLQMILCCIDGISFCCITWPDSDIVVIWWYAIDRWYCSVMFWCDDYGIDILTHFR